MSLRTLTAPLLMAAGLSACSLLQSADVGALALSLREEGARAPLLNRFVQQQPAITTSIADARTELPPVDTYAPERVGSLLELPRAPAGGFVLRPGAFELVAQSYCLHAGTHGPTEGDGYLYAPLLGPAAPSIRHILQGSAQAPDIDQHDIQALIWAILSHTKVEELNPRLQQVAARLLTPMELVTLNRTALDLVPSGVKNEALSRLPPAARQVFEAEARLREMLTRANASYEELERTAVLAGLAPLGPGSRSVASGRWSFHPSGLFIRYFPEGYSTTRVQVLVPEPISVERDKLGRITALSDGAGNRVETAYDDAQPALTFPGQPGLTGHAFRSVQEVRRHIAPPELVLDLKTRWERRGWVLVGVPSSAVTAPSSKHFPEAAARTTWAAEHAAFLERLAEPLQVQPEPKALAEAVALAEYAQALEQVASEGGRDEELGHPASLARRAWFHAVCRMLGRCSGASLAGADASPRVVLASASPTASPPEPTFDPSADVATPGNTSKQRLAQSERPQKQKERYTDCGRARRDRDEAEKLREAYGDQALRQQALREGGRINKYRELVHKKVFGPSAQEVASGNKGNQQAPMWTDPTTCRVTENWSRERYKQEGFSDVNHDADAAHEQVHHLNCTNTAKYPNPRNYDVDMHDPDKLGPEEEAAYTAKVEFLDKWMRTHCQ